MSEQKQQQDESRVDEVLSTIATQYNEVMNPREGGDVVMDTLGEAIIAEVAGVIDENDDKEVMLERARHVLERMSGDLKTVKYRI